VSISDLHGLASFKKSIIWSKIEEELGRNIMAENLNPNEPRVIVKPLAYLKMMRHVLRFGSIVKTKKQCKECMGMLMGKLGQMRGTLHDVIVEDVVEITHGGHIEVSFDDKDYVAFADVNERYAAQGIFNIGWYHSHPGLTVFLSTVDVRNHLGFQTTNASAIAIVWDHVLLEEEKHIGFETFRLKEISKGQYSDYAVVPTIVEPPTTKDFYKLVIKDLLDNLQAGNPPMFELNELPNILGEFEPSPVNDDRFIPPKAPTAFTSTAPATVGSAKINPTVLSYLATYMDGWAADLGQKLKNKGVVFNQNLTALKDVIDKGVKSIQNWFLTGINEGLLDIWEKIDTPLEQQIEAMKPGLGAIQTALPIAESSQKDMDLSIEELLKQVQDAKAAYMAKKGGK
jgi:proteasome lid subunit RPN8/RPN11